MNKYMSNENKPFWYQTTQEANIKNTHNFIKGGLVMFVNPYWNSYQKLVLVFSWLLSVFCFDFTENPEYCRPQVSQVSQVTSYGGASAGRGDGAWRNELWPLPVFIWALKSLKEFHAETDQSCIKFISNKDVETAAQERNKYMKVFK